MAAGLVRDSMRFAVPCAVIMAAAVAVSVVILAASTRGEIAPDDGIRLLAQAQRQCGGAPQTDVKLPDTVFLARGETGPVQCDYRLAAPHGPRDSGLYVPGLSAFAVIEVNGVEVFNSRHGAMQTLPRSIDRVVLVDVPDAVWRDAGNVVDIRASGPYAISMSRVRLGPVEPLRRHQRLRIMGVFVGPSLVAAVVGTLGLCMLLLWARRRDSLYGYFGLGTLCWGLHTLWTVSPWTPFVGVHQTVWWTTAYTFFVSMLIIFCVRFGGFSWPRFERLLMAVPPVSVLLLYASADFGHFALGTELVRLAMLAMVGTGLVAVMRGAIAGPTVDLMLVIASGTAAFGFGLHDWIAELRGDNDATIDLVPYAGVMFALFVVRMLIDRFARTTEQLEAMNADLEQRVTQQTAELLDAMERMRHARDAAEAADQAKTRFLAAASHDLRQPAHALTLYMATLRCENLDSRQSDLVERMSGSLSALETMFNMLLDVSRIDAGGMKPEATTFSVDEMLRRLADEFAPQAEAQGLRLALHLPPPTGVLAHGDRGLVERALRNLLANAVKYTTHGGVLLACRLRSGATPGSRRWRLEVWDTGVGISEGDKPRVFEEFFQVDNPSRDRAKGLGLGLSIVQRIADLLELDLVMGSKVGRGSFFALHLPRVVDASGRHDDHASLISTSGVAGIVVAMIEDDVEVRSAMRSLLEQWGCRVAAGADADEVMANLRANGGAARPEAILVDQRLDAGRTGPEEAQLIFDRLGAVIPMLVITGEADVAPIVAAGHACMTKPISPGLLRDWLASVRTRSSAPAADLAPIANEEMS